MEENAFALQVNLIDQSDSVSENEESNMNISLTTAALSVKLLEENLVPTGPCEDEGHLDEVPVVVGYADDEDYEDVDDLDEDEDQEDEDDEGLDDEDDEDIDDFDEGEDQEEDEGLDDDGLDYDWEEVVDEDEDNDDEDE
jgi:hypothetical protein